MKHLMTLWALVVAVTAGAQVIDTTFTENAVHMNLNLSKLDSTINAMQQIIDAQQAEIESLQNSAFDGDYNSLSNLPTLFDGDYSSLSNLPTLFDGDYSSLSNQPTIPSNVSDLSNDAGFTTVSQADSIAVGVAWRGELSGADLYGADLREANLAGADLSGADLYGASLVEADLYVANLSSANLSSANLFQANLFGANLYGADLTGAYLYGVTWTAAYIENCTGCTCVDANNDNYCD